MGDAYAESPHEPQSSPRSLCPFVSVSSHYTPCSGSAADPKYAGAPSIPGVGSCPRWRFSNPFCRAGGGGAVPGGGRLVAVGPLPRRVPVRTKARYEILASLPSRPSPAWNKPRWQQKRRPPGAGAGGLVRGRAVVPALRSWQPPARSTHRARRGCKRWHRPRLAPRRSLQGLASWVRGDAPLGSPGRGRAVAFVSCPCTRGLVTSGVTWGTAAGLCVPGFALGRCLLCPAGDRARGKGQTLLITQPRRGQSSVKRAVVTELRGHIDESLPRLGAGGGTASRGRVAAGGAGRFQSGWPPPGFVVWFGLVFFLLQIDIF